MKYISEKNKEKYQYLTKLNFDILKRKIGTREETGHKGIFGALFCLCGSRGMAGAAGMSILAALRSGVGLVKAAVPKSVYNVLAARLFEAVFVPLEEDKKGVISLNSLEEIITEAKSCSAALIGCGLGKKKELNLLIQKLLGRLNMNCIIDADGINALAENINILKRAKCQIILTPHIGEMARLLKVSKKEVLENPFEYTKNFSMQYKVVTVLKSSETVISDETGSLFINRRPNSGMAKGGSGDVLAGIIGSFLAQGMNAIDSSICGVVLHSMAGEFCRKKLSKTSMLPTDLINELPEIFLKMNR